jgi:hypothetical protein
VEEDEEIDNAIVTYVVNCETDGVASHNEMTMTGLSSNHMYANMDATLSRLSNLLPPQNNHILLPQQQRPLCPLPTTGLLTHYATQNTLCAEDGYYPPTMIGGERGGEKARFAARDALPAALPVPTTTSSKNSKKGSEQVEMAKRCSIEFLRSFFHLPIAEVADHFGKLR